MYLTNNKNCLELFQLNQIIVLGAKFKTQGMTSPKHELIRFRKGKGTRETIEMQTIVGKKTKRHTHCFYIFRKGF